MKTVRKFIYIERLNAGTGSLGPLEVYRSTRPWKCKTSNSLVIRRLLESLFLLRDLMLELGALVPWKCIEALELGSVRIIIVLLYEDC